MTKLVWLKIWPAALIVFVVLLFHIRLFFPVPSMYTTPDFGRSDFVNFNIPMKYVLKESLKDFKLPLWEKNIGQGYPVFAEGQVGALYPPNLILFATLPLWLAFNLSIIVAFLTAAFGTYLLARSLYVSKAGSILAAFTYTFSPIIVLHVQHLNLAQTAAIFPWQLLIINNFFKKKELRFLIFFSLITSIQIFAGFQQIVVYSLFGVFVYSIFKVAELKRNITKIKITLIMFAFIIFSFATSAAQLLPSYELSNEAQRTLTTTPKSVLEDFPFKFINLKTIVNPYILGSPIKGTFPPFKLGVWGIFWEGNAYFGITQLLFIFLLCILIIKKKKNKIKNLNTAPLFTIGIIGILLSLGKDAPFHILFSIPPFSLFRVPSRFLIFTFVSAAILSGIALDKIFLLKNKKILNIVFCVVIMIITYDSFRVWFKYHLTESVDTIFTPPSIRNYIDNEGRLFSYGAETEWTSKHFIHGWDKNADIYTFLRNTFSQNSNLLYGVSQHNAYAGMSTRRSSIAMITASEHISSDNDQLKIGSASQNLLNANNVRFMTTTEKLISGDWQLLTNTSKDGTTIFLYKNIATNQRVYVPNDYAVTNTISGFKALLEKDVDISRVVVLEEDVDIPKNVSNRGTAQIVVDGNTEIEISANLNEKSLVTLSDSYYPGWKAYVDGLETKIYPTNVNSRSVIVPSGKHKIVYKFVPQTVKTGALISIASLALTLLILLKPQTRNYRFKD